jgi:GrpB-like predicted nucleotidyltransferase (UPF0157 family)
MILGLKRGTAELAEHDPEWKKLAAETINLLWNIFGSIAKDIQHFGSTAITNIKAKPIIDIAVAVDDFEKIETLIPVMEQNGFLRYQDLNQRFQGLNTEWRMFSAHTDSTLSVDTYHVHIIKNKSSQWQNCICFRDYMNDNPNAAREYEKIKLDLVKKFKNDREAYRLNKNIFIEHILKIQSCNE